MQVTYAKPLSFTAGATDFGVTEVRTCTEGQELYVGFPFDAIGGRDIIDKINMIHTMTMQQMQECTGGFHAVLTPCKTLVIPAGYVFGSVPVSDKPTISIRWGSIDVSNRRSCSNAMESVREMLNTTDGLADDETWMNWKTFLEKRCEDLS